MAPFSGLNPKPGVDECMRIATNNRIRHFACPSGGERRYNSSGAPGIRIRACRRTPPGRDTRSSENGELVPIYHITHLRNLESILQFAGLCSENSTAQKQVEAVSIAHAHIKERRGRRVVPVAQGGTLNDYIPFYFAPRSPMLYAIHKGNVEGYQDGQGPILHLVSSVESVVEAGLPFAFTNGHAEMAVSDFFDSTDRLDEVDWKIMKAKYWADTDDDNDRCRRRLAEFLVHEFFPWELCSMVGAMNSGTADEVNEILAKRHHRPKVKIKQGWYY